MMKKPPESKNGAKGPKGKRARSEAPRESANGVANGGPSARGGIAGFREQLWASADKLRGNMDASEYKNVVLGLIFLKYISDAFDQLHVKLAADPKSDPEDRDEYLAENVFWVPENARWKALQAQSKL